MNKLAQKAEAAGLLAGFWKDGIFVTGDQNTKDTFVSLLVPPWYLWYQRYLSKIHRRSA